MLREDLRVGFVSASSSIKRGNKKTTIFIILILALIYMNLGFLPSLTEGMVDAFAGSVRHYAYGDVLIEPTERNFYVNNADNILKRVRSIEGVQGTTKRLASGGSVKYKQKSVGVNVIGLDPTEERGISKYPDIVREGEFLEEQDTDKIMIGAIIAGTSPASQVYDNLESITVGSLVNVTYSNGVTRTYKVKGIHEGGSEITDLNVIVHYKELESVLNLTGQDKASTIIVKVERSGTEEEMKKKIIDVGVKADVFTWQEKAEALIRQALQSIGALGVMSTIVSLIVGAALIFIIIYINTVNRKREIGILKAIGISPQSIMISYVFISLFYTLLGVLLGVVLLVGVILYLQANPLIFFGALEVAPKLNIGLLVKNIVMMLILAIIAGFVPAWMVAKQDILKAIWGN